ncbi:MAG: FAD-dependent oxidoreductase [Gammaproteobacteria bacterium]|nr:MAG: FAD-dependent oxidoreductase [Gammaproteobacteria bacterium]
MNAGRVDAVVIGAGVIGLACGRALARSGRETLDLAGRVRFGPDVAWIDREDYAFDDSNRAHFVAAIERYFPELDPQRLRPDQCGIRARLGGPETAFSDFRIDGGDMHGMPGLVNLLGIESPGLTASLAIAEAVLGRL